MLRLLADENFNNDIVRGVRRRMPSVDILRVQDVALSGVDDPTVLERAAGEGRVLLTHDVATMTRYAYDPGSARLGIPRVFEVGRHFAVGVAIDEIVLLASCSLDGEWVDQFAIFP